MTFRPEDHVRVRLEPTDDWCDAFVTLASRQALGLQLNGIVRSSNGILTGALPILLKKGKFVGLWGDEYEIERHGH